MVFNFFSQGAQTKSFKGGRGAGRGRGHNATALLVSYKPVARKVEVGGAKNGGKERSM